MKSVVFEVPDQIATAVGEYVKAGFFDSEADVFVAAMADFIRRNRIDLLEHFAREDIAWAKKETKKAL